jgi:hypothetical protein
MISQVDIDRFKQIGCIQLRIELPPEVQHFILEENYKALDECLGDFLKNDGIIYNALLPLGPINKTEYLIAIRKGEDDDEGIWHDDGSREIAFTLSLVSDLSQLSGGILLFRHKENREKTQAIPTPPYGTLTIIKTGKDGYEHRVQKVTSGKRVICAGWIN